MALGQTFPDSVSHTADGMGIIPESYAAVTLSYGINTVRISTGVVTCS